MTTRNVYFFVFDGFADWEAPYALAGISDPQFQRQPGAHALHTIAAEKGRVTSAGGLRIEPWSTLDAVDTNGAPMLILPGGKPWDEGRNMDAVALAQRVLAAGGAAAAICGATAGLARGGLLDHRRHTSNSREYLAATHYHGGALYEDARAVADGPLITAGSTAPVDFAYQIFRNLRLYEDEVLEAWYGLFTTGKPEYYEAMTRSAA